MPTKKKSTSQITGFTSTAARDAAVSSGRISASAASSLPTGSSSSNRSSGGSSNSTNTVNYNSNTGQALKKGESFVDNATGQRFTQGEAFSPTAYTTARTTGSTASASSNTYKVTNNPVATYGENSASIKALQQQLNAKGANLKVDGMYGPLTAAAVAKWGGSTTQSALTAGTEDEDLGTPYVSPDQKLITDAQAKLAKIDKEREDAYKKFVKDTNAIIRGSVPLSTAQQAQVDGLSSQYRQLIDQQTTQNVASGGIANVRGYQTGSAEYDPSFQTKVIGSIFTAGVNKVADLNTKMASSVGELTQAFKDDNIKAVKDAYDAYKEYEKERATALQSLIDDAQANIKDYYDRVTTPLQELAENARNAGAPTDVVERILNSGSLAQGYREAGDYAVGGTGIIGEYNFYKAQAIASGQTPMSFDNYQDKDANRKKSIAAAAYGAGYSNTTVTKIQQIAGQFDNEQVVKDYNVTSTQVNFIKDLGGTPTDDIARVYAFAKVMDPNSVVREGEYKTVQDYAQAVWQAAGLKGVRVFANTGFLTNQARSFMNNTLTARLKTQERTYRNIYDEYGRRIDKISGGSDGKEFLTDYSKGYNPVGETVANEASSEATLSSYITLHPNEREAIGAKKATLMQQLGLPDISVSEFLSYYPEYKQ